MARPRQTKASRVAGLGKTTMLKYKQLCDVLGSAHSASSMDGADLDDRLCMFWLSEGLGGRQRLARVVRENQVRKCPSAKAVSSSAACNLRCSSGYLLARDHRGNSESSYAFCKGLRERESQRERG